MEVVVKIGDAGIGYGFEYQGSAEHILITPLTERAFLSITAAVSCMAGALCMGPEGSGKRSTVRELSLCLGMALFVFNCTRSMDHSILQDICKGLASAGAWICFNGLEQLPLPELTTLGQLLGQIQAARHSGKETVSLQMEEISLHPAGACLAVIGSSVSGTPSWRRTSASYMLPEGLLSRYRIVSISEVPLSFILESLLLIRGFSRTAVLARKLLALLDVSSKLFKTFSATVMKTQYGVQPGWSMSAVQSLLSEAKDVLQSLKSHSDSAQGDGVSGNADENRLHALEDRAIMSAIHHCVFPQLTGDKVKLFESLVAALWPEVVSVTFNDSSDMHWNIPAVTAPEDKFEQQVPPAQHAEETSCPPDITKAVTLAAKKRHITPGTTFVSNVSHLVQLASKYQTVALIGPAGCGKSECVKTYAETFRQMGRRATVNTIFIRALESRNLLGYMDRESGWVDGLLPKLLRKYCYQHESYDETHLKLLHLDGEIDEEQMELMMNIFHRADTCVLENNERVKLSASLRIFWELDTLANVSPAVACRLAILAMARSDTDWKLLLSAWVATHDAERQQLLQRLTESFLEPTMLFFKKKLMTEHRTKTKGIALTEDNVMQTFFRIFQALSLTVPEILPEDMKKYFLFSCIWAFGGSLESQQKTTFSRWWRKHFRNHCVFPGDGEIWDYYVDSETHQFMKWNENISPYSIPHGQGIPSEAFVRTVHAEQTLFLSNLLSVAGWPVILVGEAGCGKSAIMQEHISTLCSGDVVELLELKIATNRSTDTKMVWGCLKERLEWRNGSLYAPAGNKKLLCLFDDLHLAKVDQHGSQPACEFVRQLLDQGGIFDPFSHEWKTVRNIIYLATLAMAAPTERYPMPSQRLLRHFCVLHCPYPSQRDQIGIFSTMLSAHFLQPVTDTKAGGLMASVNDHLQELLLAVTTITVELQERMRSAFLGTSERCHYIFTLRDLSKVFRNICLSLDGNTTSEKLLYLWRHECDWVYGHRMVSLVDYSRYEQEYTIAAKKVLSNEEQLHLILSLSQPLFSNIIEDEGGLITTSSKQQEFNFVKRNEKAGNQIHALDGYQPTFDMPSVQKLLKEAMREYNKSNPRISMTFYKDTLEHLCRLTRNLWSPHESAHTMLCGEGCPKSSALLVRLAAHLCGFTVVQVGSPPTDQSTEWKAHHFKTQLVDSYINAGLKGQHTIFLLTEEEADNAALVYMRDFVVSGSVSHLFTSEQQATIANAMRSEVTSAGLTYSKESAWNFFLQSVQQNFRWILIYPSTGASFYRKCLEFPSLVNALNVYFIPHWAKEKLVAHADHYIQHLEMLSNREKENVCHLLASMHLAIANYDRCKQGRGEYGHITNATFETFVQCFTNLMKKKHHEVMEVHELMKSVLTYTETKMKSYTALANDLEQQMAALNEHKEGTLQILVQIAQDKVVVEQKIHSVQQHMKKIKGFQKLLPEYQLAHEKAVYKASAIIADIKKLVMDMDIGALGELRGMQKPDVDTEELMASIIIILKSPNTDLTWSKGAKRQMANMDRFLNELSSFDKIQLSESTLELLESNIKKSTFTVENMERKAGGNVAAGTLLRWLQRAVHYYRLKASKVKPLQRKVEEMRVALEEAEQKMKSLQQKKDALIVRLNGLEKSFEEATIDKSKQEQKTIGISQRLQKAGALIQLLGVENNKYTQIIGSLQDRLSGLPGSTAIAAGFASYLGAYESLFRQLILTVEWPKALKERGFPLVIDSIDPVEGRVIDFAVQFFWEDPEQKDITDSTVIPGAELRYETLDSDESELRLEDLISDHHAIEGMAVVKPAFHPNLSLPIISEDHYREYMEALLTILVKESEIQEWIVRDWTQNQMENAAILHFSWQRPALLIDPCCEGKKWFDAVQGSPSKMVFTSVTLKTRQDNSILAPIEKAIATGSSLVLHNYSNKWDHLLKPLIDHCCALIEHTVQQGPSDILSFNGHRLLCSDQFKLYLVSSEDEPQLSAEISSGTTIINFSPCEDSLGKTLLHRAFACIQPELHIELQKVTKAILQQQHSLQQLEKMVRDCFISSDTKDVDNTERMIAIFNHKQEVSEKLQETKSLRNKLVELRNQLLPLASRGAVLFAMLKALRPLAAEYQFSLRFFLQLFDKAIGARDVRTECDIQIEDIKGGFMRPPPSSPPSEPDAGAQETFGNQGQDESGMKEILTVPHGPEIPSPGVKYLGLAANQIKELMEHLTKTFYQTMAQSLLPEHTLLASTLLCFQIQQQGKENLFSDSELAFFVQGRSAFGNSALGLGDMGSDLTPPPWLPSDRWDDVLVLSTVPGILHSVCIQVAAKSSIWEKWYNSLYPELETFPFEATENKEDLLRFSSHPDQDTALEFQKLLILRAMRPDRIPAALSRYLRKHMSGLVPSSSVPDIDEISSLPEEILGVLVLLQQQQGSTKSSSYESTVMSLDPACIICTAAKNRGIPVSTVSIENGHASGIKTSLDDIMNQDGWLIIENLQLATKKFLEDLRQNMIYAKKMKESHNEKSHFCVWLTTEPGGPIPQHFLKSLKKVSWHVFLSTHITTTAVLGPLAPSGSPVVLMQVAILSALDQVKEDHYVKLKAMQMNIRIFCFGVCVLHGILLVQQALPGTGLTHLLTVSRMQLNQAIKAVIALSLKKQTSEQDFLQVLKDIVSNVYTNLTTRSEDMCYIQALTHEIINKCQQQTDSIDIGGLTVPVPSTNVEPLQYSTWLSEKFPKGCSVGEPLLPRRTERAATVAHSAQFLQGLADMADALQSGFPPSNPQRYKSVREMFRLRRSLDTISEQLPPLLEVGTLASDESSYLSAHLRCSHVGGGYEEALVLPETIGYGLLQECYWMNALLFYINQQVADLSKALVAGSFALPEHLSMTVIALQKGDLPQAWLHPHCRPSLHSLLSWLTDLQQKHSQLKQWLKKGLMPFANGEKGALTAIRPGGLVNPEALFVALRHEYALLHGYLLDEVVLHCQISEYPDYKPEAQGYPLCLERLVMQNATWDFKRNHLMESRNELFPLPFVTVTPAHHMDVKSNEEGIEIYECPLYLDNTTQLCVAKVPLLCSHPVQQWHLRRVAIILNPEPGVFFPPKLNSFGTSRPRDRRQHQAAMNTRSLTDRSFYHKLFHPTRESTYHQGIPPMKLDQHGAIDLHEMDTTSANDNMEFQADHLDGNVNLLEDHQHSEVQGDVVLPPLSMDAESTSPEGEQEDIIRQKSFSRQKSHQTTNVLAVEDHHKGKTPENKLETQQDLPLQGDKHTDSDRHHEPPVDSDSSSDDTANGNTFDKDGVENLDTAINNNNSNPSSHASRDDAKHAIMDSRNTDDYGGVYDNEDNFLDSDMKYSPSSKQKMDFQMEDLQKDMDLLQEHQNEESSDSLGLFPSSVIAQASNTEQHLKEIIKQPSSPNQKSHQTTERTTDEEMARTDLETFQELPLESINSQGSHREEIPFFDGEQNKLVAEKSSSFVGENNKDYEDVKKENNVTRTESSDGSRDTSEEYAGEAVTVNGYENGDSETYQDNRMESDHALNINADDQPGDNHSSDDHSFDYEPNIDDNYEKYEHDYENEVRVETNPTIGDLGGAELRNRSAGSQPGRDNDNGGNNDTPERNLESAEYNENPQVTTTSFLGLITESEAESESEDDFNF